MDKHKLYAKCVGLIFSSKVKFLFIRFCELLCNNASRLLIGKCHSPPSVVPALVDSYAVRVATDTGFGSSAGGTCFAPPARHKAASAGRALDGQNQKQVGRHCGQETCPLRSRHFPFLYRGRRLDCVAPFLRRSSRQSHALTGAQVFALLP